THAFRCVGVSGDDQRCVASIGKLRDPDRFASEPFRDFAPGHGVVESLHGVDRDGEAGHGFSNIFAVNLWQALFMGLLQGATELFPVSSLGHAVLIPSLLKWSFKQSDPSFLPFLVLLHIGTAAALLVLYRQEWVAIIRGFFSAAFRGQIQTDTE